MTSSLDALALCLGLEGSRKRIVRVELWEERAQDYLRQSREQAKAAGGGIRFKLVRRIIRADCAEVVAHVILAWRVDR